MHCHSVNVTQNALCLGLYSVYCIQSQALFKCFAQLRLEEAEILILNLLLE